jgi:hypothetical protein
MFPNKISTCQLTGIFFLLIFIKNKVMKIEQLNLITEYSKGVLNKESIIKINGEDYYELLEFYLNDLNSSTIRQDITCNVLGLKTSKNKLGYDSDSSNDEIKPKNISAKKLKKTNLTCGGGYSDLTHKRHKKFIEDNVMIHCSGFIDGQLMFIIGVPYSDLESHFKQKLDKHLPNGDVINNYVRSATFSFTQIKTCPNTKIEFIRGNIDDFKLFIGKELYKFLKKNENV